MTVVDTLRCTLQPNHYKQRQGYSAVFICIDPFFRQPPCLSV